MKHLLGRDSVEVLAQFSWSRVLLAFDYDGTLAPIVDDRNEAWLRPETMRLFERVCELYPCAVISGRTQRDVARRLASARVSYVAGNQRLDSGARTKTFERQIATCVAQLERALAGVVGLDIEDKRASLAIHYRRCRRKQEARVAIARAVADLPPGMRVIPGKLIVQVVPSAAPNKGDTLLALRAKAGADTAVYIGDDNTDEDVFGLDQPGQLLGVRVGRSAVSSAAFYLRDQAEVDDLLRALIALRQGNTQLTVPRSKQQR